MNTFDWTSFFIGFSIMGGFWLTFVIAFFVALPYRKKKGE